jgi:hypothetical protein
MMKLAQVLHRKFLLKGCNDAMKQIHRGGSQHNIIHIQQEIGSVAAMMKHEQQGI